MGNPLPNASRAWLDTVRSLRKETMPSSIAMGYVHHLQGSCKSLGSEAVEQRVSNSQIGSLNLGLRVGYCPHPLTVYIRNPSKGYI